MKYARLDESTCGAAWRHSLPVPSAWLGFWKQQSKAESTKMALAQISNNSLGFNGICGSIKRCFIWV